jgi:hypothetical protein
MSETVVEFHKFLFIEVNEKCIICKNSINEIVRDVYKEISSSRKISYTTWNNDSFIEFWILLNREFSLY